MLSALGGFYPRGEFVVLLLLSPNGTVGTLKLVTKLSTKQGLRYDRVTILSCIPPKYSPSPTVNCPEQ